MSELCRISWWYKQGVSIRLQCLRDCKEAYGQLDVPVLATRSNERSLRACKRDNIDSAARLMMCFQAFCPSVNDKL